MKKIHFIVIVLLGLFLMPSEAVACGNNKNVSSCGMEMTSKTKKKQCCSKKSNSKSKKEKSCTGKCGMSICNANSSISIAIYSDSTFEILQTAFDFNTKKQIIDHTSFSPSAGYGAIWLIPKIG